MYEQKDTLSMKQLKAHGISISFLLLSAPVRGCFSAMSKEADTQENSLTEVDVEKGTLLLNRFRVQERIGRGGFGQIYNVRDEITNQLFAMKWQTSDDHRRLKLEMSVLLQLRGKRHCPVLIACGRHNSSAFLILQKLGKNLAELRREQTSRSFTPGTVYRIADQLFTALHDLHHIGCLHRDIKPSNMCIGQLDRRRIFLIDFGLVRPFTTLSGNVRPRRDLVGFRGTARYTPLIMHHGQEQGVSGDLISTIYAIVELYKGRLPWSTSLQKPEEVAAIKERTTLEQLCEHMPKPFLEVAKYIWKLDYAEYPDYALILAKIDESLVSCCGAHFDKLKTEYDWEYTDAERALLGPRPTKQTQQQKETRTPRQKSMIVKRGSNDSCEPAKEATPFQIRVEPATMAIPVASSCKLKLSNENEARVLWMAKTTNTDFVLSPHIGVLPPRSSITATASIKPGAKISDSTTEHFKIYFVELPDKEAEVPLRELAKRHKMSNLIRVPLTVNSA